MVLGHQVSVHNQLAAANFQGRTTERDSEAMNRALERPVDFESDSTRSRYASAAEKLVEAILMVDEYEFSDTISGTSSFAKDFEVRGPFDTQGRSLRQFDLKRRLFRYPCSFLIYSDAFDGLPKRIRQQVYSRLWEILTGADQSQQFAHLTTTDRRAILEILDETKQDLSQSWNSRKK